MKEVNITFSNGITGTYQYGIRASELVSQFGTLKNPLAAVLVDNELCSLHSRIEINCELKPVTIESSLGSQVYRRSLCFVLAIAARGLFPDKKLVVGQAIGNGFYYSLDDDKAVSKEDIDKLQARMNGIILENQVIRHSVISWRDAQEHFKKTNQGDTLMLLENLSTTKVPVNICRGFMDLAVSPLVGSTGVLKIFDLMQYHEGFLLRFPDTGNADVIAAFDDNPLLYSVYKEYKKWGKVAGVSCVGDLNRINTSKSMKSYMQISEALHNKKLAEIADKIAAQSESVRCVLIAGPSSSGKTTTSKKLAIQLKVLGFEPLNISLDDYFVDRDKTPKDENGDYDFECLEALDIAYLNQQLLDLFAGKEIELPAFDFKIGKRKPSGNKLRMKGNEILIMEGIHGLNDKLTYRIPREQKFKIYVSALTQLNLDDHNRIATTDNRLLRRMVRDFQFRGHSAKNTIKMWPSVNRGAKKHIFAFQNTADAAFNSALDFELGVLRIYAEPLLRSVKPSDPEFAEASRILSFIENFAPIPAQFVSRDSILREFIGESDFKY